MKHLVLILLIYMAGAHPASAQYNASQNMVWAFGNKAGLSFSTGGPVPIATNIFAPEGSASVCDKDGNLLFYTDGRKVWDATHTIMPGGDSICPYNTISTEQGTVIAPVLDYAAGSNPTKYYIFSIYSLEYLTYDTGGKKMYYSIVDMTLNGGLGGIVPGMSRIYLASRMCEKIITIPGSNCDLWVLTHKMGEQIFYAHNITACGLNTTPVVSAAGTMSGWFSYLGGIMKASHDRRRIAVFNSTSSLSPTDMAMTDHAQTGTELLNFDPATGIVSNGVRISTHKGDSYGEFSPDNTKLYTMGRDTSYYIHQYDITDTTAITRHTVTTGNMIGGDMRLAPDGKIYVADSFMCNSINCIANPNSAGAACNYVEHAVTTLPGTQIVYGITNVYHAPLYTPTDTANTISDTTICFEGLDSALLSSPFYDCIRWYDGRNTTAHGITGPGHYSVTSAGGCMAFRHTFNVIAAAAPCAETGIDNHSTYTGIDIYPNPAVNECTLQSSRPFTAGATARLIDVTGREVNVYQLHGYKCTIALHGITPGVYTLHITAGGSRTIKKLAVKNR